MQPSKLLRSDIFCVSTRIVTIMGGKERKCGRAMEGKCKWKKEQPCAEANVKKGEKNKPTKIMDKQLLRGNTDLMRLHSKIARSWERRKECVCAFLRYCTEYHNATVDATAGLHFPHKHTHM